MQFFDWTTDYEQYCKRIPKPKRDPYEKFFDNRFSELQEAGVPPVRIVAERFWKEEKSPYYNIHPELASKLCKVDLSRIPSQLFKMPHGLTTVNIRFAKQHQEFTLPTSQSTNAGNPSLQAVTPANSFVHGLLMHESVLSTPNERLILFVIDFNVFSSDGYPIYSVFQIELTENRTLQESIDQSRGISNPWFDRLMDNLLKLAVTIGFLSTNPTICEADVLADDRPKFREGTDEQRKFIAARAIRRGKYGFNIGTDLMFLGERPLSKGQPRHLTERELEYAHIRMGHPHAVRYGEEKKLVKIMWYTPITVRPDLPFAREVRPEI